MNVAQTENFCSHSMLNATIFRRDLVVDRRALQSMQATRVKAELALEDLLQGNKRFQEVRALAERYAILAAYLVLLCLC